MEDQLKPNEPTLDSPPPVQSHSAIALFLIWLRIGISSFGGGTATLSVIRQEFVSNLKWIEEEDFLRDWSLCQLAPGINLIAVIILIGRRLGGPISIVAAVVGVLLPSFLATVGLTAAYQYFSKSPFVISARAGIVPAVAGAGFATCWSLLTPIAKKHWKKGWSPRVFYAIALVGCFLAFRGAHLSPVLVLLGAGVSSALFALTQPKETGPLEA